MEENKKTEGPFTEFMKRRIIPTGGLIILLIVAWLGGFFWKGLSMCRIAP